MEGKTENKNKKSLTEKLIGVGQKAIIYGGNYLPKAINTSSNLGHPYTVVGNLVADIVAGCSKDFKESSIYGLSKLAGAVYFLGMSAYDLVGIVNGDHEKIQNLPFDASMCYQMIYDMGQVYKSSGKTPADDLKKTKNVLEKIVNKGNNLIDEKIGVKKN